METSQSVFNFGVMVGAIIFTTMADRLGRKPIHLACQYSMLVIGLVLAFAPNYIAFVVLRFFLGAVREVHRSNTIIIIIVTIIIIIIINWEIFVFFSCLD